MALVTVVLERQNPEACHANGRWTGRRAKSRPATIVGRISNMSDQKLSTAEILASIRGGAETPKPADDTSAVESAAPQESPESPVEDTTTEDTAAQATVVDAAPKGPAPTGTASILASIKSSGPAKSEAKPAAKAAAAKPAAGAKLDPLAAIRAGGAAPKAAAAATKKPAAKAAVKSVDTKAAAGLSAADMIRAARSPKVAGKSGSDAGKKAAVALPKKPLKKSAAPKAKDAVERRGMLAALVGVVCAPVFIAWSSISASLGVFSLGVARFMMPNVLVEPPTRFKIGPPTDYSGGTVSTKWKAQFGVWIVNSEVDGAQMIYALSTVCTHLGCTPNWLEGEQKFKCPCHGSGFYKTGVNFEGPAPRPLERMGIRLAADGMLEVDKSVKFQKELGQWENPASFVPMA